MHKGDPHGGFSPYGVQVSQDSQFPPKGDQVPIVGGGNDVPMVPLELNNREIRKALRNLARTMKTNVNWVSSPSVHSIKGSMTSRFRDIVRNNRPIFFGSNV